MEKPRTFAGRVVQKHGKTMTNDYAQPEKFFADMADFYRLIDGIPFSAVEDLKKYELNREIVVSVMRRLYQILDAADVDIVEEIERQMRDDPFDGLEEDIAMKKQSQIKISGED